MIKVGDRVIVDWCGPNRNYTIYFGEVKGISKNLISIAVEKSKITLLCFPNEISKLTVLCA